MELLPPQRPTWVQRIPEDGHPGAPRHSLLEQLQLLPERRDAQATDACDVPSWPREAGDEPRAHRIAHVRHDDGNQAGGLLRRTARLRPRRDKDIDVQLDQLGHEVAEPLGSSLCPAVFDNNILSLHVAEVAERLTEVGSERPKRVSEIHYAGELRRQLRLSGKWQREDAEDKHDKASHGTKPHGPLLTSVCGMPHIRNMPQTGKYLPRVP